jgi:hypothetical protein
MLIKRHRSLLQLYSVDNSYRREDRHQYTTFSKVHFIIEPYICIVKSIFPLYVVINVGLQYILDSKEKNRSKDKAQAVELVYHN